MRLSPFFTKSQRRALWFLETLLLVVIIALSVHAWMVPETATDNMEKARTTHRRENITYATEETPVETFPFDPNTADSTTLLRLGLSPWQVRSIYRYRAKHGRYHIPEDFMSLPGMTNELWQRLGPMVRIAAAYRYVTPPHPAHSRQKDAAEKTQPTVPDTTDSVETQPAAIGQEAVCHTTQRPAKLAAGQLVDVNTADTTLLKMIPGIGTKRAASIVAYRQKLGGFVSAEQAMEAIEMPDSVLKWMKAEPLPVRKICINEWSVQQLMAHPYVSFYQAKAINELRRDKGKIQSLEELSRIKQFKPSDIERLEPYIAF